MRTADPPIPLPLSPLRHLRESEEVSQTARAFIGVRELLLRGEFARGERISEVPLAARLGVSRTPIRMALERLAHVGLLDVGATGGFLVREFTIDEVRDAIELRAVLEGTAARLAAERVRDDGELDGLRALLGGDRPPHAAVDRLVRRVHGRQRVVSCRDRRSREERDAAAHARSGELAAVCGSERDGFPTSMLAAAEETLATAQVHHRSIVEAIRRREGTRAEHLAREHGRLAWRAFELALSDENALRRVPGGPLINVSSS